MRLTAGEVLCELALVCAAGPLDGMPTQPATEAAATTAAASTHIRRKPPSRALPATGGRAPAAGRQALVSGGRALAAGRQALVSGGRRWLATRRYLVGRVGVRGAQAGQDLRLVRA